MTKPRIDEITAPPDYDKNEAKCFYRGVEDGRQAGIDEAVEIVEKTEITKKVVYDAEDDYERGKKIGYNDGIYRAKGDIIKALQGKK